MAKPYSEIQLLLNNFTANDHNWQGEEEPRRAMKQKAGLLELDDISAMRADLAKLANQMTRMTMGTSQPMQQVQQMSVCCELCGDNHTSDMCPTNPESIYYVGKQSRGPMNQQAQYGNTYNANWRNHPNFSWGGNQSNQNQYRPQGNFNQPQRPPQQAEESTNDLLKKLLQDNQQLRTDFRNIERQMGQLATNQNTRPAGALPGDTEKNPQVSAITLRTGRELEEVSSKKKNKQIPEGELIPKATQEEKKDDTIPAPVNISRPPPPFPQRLQRKNDDLMFNKFLSMLSQIQLNIPLDSLEKAIVLFESLEINDEVEEMKHNLDATCEYIKGFNPFEPLNRTDGPPLKPSVEEAPKLELKLLPSHLHYTYLGSSETLPVIISADLSELQEEKLLRKEVIKWLDAGIVFPISDSKWVSPVQCVPKKGGMTVVTNENNDLIPIRTVTGRRICINYRKLNNVTRKDHFPLPFIDQMLDRLVGQEYYYCFLDGYSGYNQIVIAPEDQEKTTFTCPYGTYAFKRMPFGLCNAPATFQRCMMAIFTDMVERFVEVFMDDFSVFGCSFDECLMNLDKVLARCEETNLVLNWEKCHFMVREGIVLGHKVSKNGLQVDKAKVEAIEKLPPPTSVRGIRSFLGHAGFYRRFIKDFSKISSPLCRLLEKDTSFKFDDACLKAFDELKRRLVTAPIIISPDWKLPFELMCDASDIAIGAVLGQRKEKIFCSIHYASRTLNSSQMNYTVTEKELLAVVPKNRNDHEEARDAFTKYFGSRTL
ncbi:uncharacterized protein [Nicotiana sylvestris]|uniref:uncharacterized protein n=1 Tax=Nicotiana sylvestris TaxID=4096 RepID=UPI00388C5255